MSNISTVYDALKGALPVLFSSKLDIPNPYSLEDNAVRMLVNSYGIKINDVTEGPIDVLKDTNVTYAFSVVLTSELVRMESDTAILHTTVKQLYEDALIVRKDYLNADQLGVPDNVEKIDYVSTTGVQYFNKGKNSFVSIEIDFNVEISETI